MALKREDRVDWVYDSAGKRIGFAERSGSTSNLVRYADDNTSSSAQKAWHAAEHANSSVAFSIAQAASSAISQNSELRQSVSATEVTSALTTSAVGSYLPPATTYAVRISWTNNGGTGTAKLNVALNCSNDVHGLVACQSSKMRDLQMTIGDVYVIRSTTPITAIHYLSDTAFSSGQHSLKISYEVAQ